MMRKIGLILAIMFMASYAHATNYQRFMISDDDGVQQENARLTNDTSFLIGGATAGIAGTGQDGSLKLYSEQGVTDYTLTLSPNATMTANTTLYMPAAVSAANDYPLIGSTDGVLSWNDQAVKTTSSPAFVTVKLSGLTDGYVPYHVSDATGLANSPIFTDAGNVGIGTTSPGYQLEIKDPDTNALGGIYFNAASSVNVPYPGSVSNKVIANYRGYGFSTDAITLTTPPSFGIGLAANRAGSLMVLRNNNVTNPVLQIEKGAIGMATSIIQDTSVYDAIYRGTFIGANFTNNYYTQLNASYSSWGIDIGGIDNSSYAGTTDTFSIIRQAAGAAHTARTRPFLITSAGRIGVGTIAPDNVLQVIGTNPDGIEVATASGAQRYRVAMTVSATAAYIDSYKLGTGAGGKYLSLNPNGGNVGIGTSAPKARTHIDGGSLLVTGQEAISTGAGQPIGVQLRYGSTANTTELISYDWLNNAPKLLALRGYTVDIQTGTYGSTSALFVNNSGNVGIGTAAPETALDVIGVVSVDHDNFLSTLGNYNIIWSNAAAGGLQVYNAAGTSPLVTVLDGGNVGIGTTAPLRNLDVAGTGGALAPLGRFRAADTAILEIQTDSSASAVRTPILALRRSYGTYATPVVVASGYNIGQISGYGYDGSDYETNAASIGFAVDGAVSTSVVPGRITFSTAATSGADALTERMRIDSSGNVGINVTPTAQLHIDQSSTTGAKPVLTLDQADVSEEFIRLIGTSANGVLTQSVVEAADVGTFTTVGYIKVYIQDDGNQVTDGVYYMAFGNIAAP